MKKLLVLLTFLVILLSACQSKTLYFNGESENWTGKVRVIQTGDTQEQNFTLKYEGENLKNVTGKLIEYRIEESTGISEGTGPLSKGGVLKSNDFGDVCSGCAFVQEDSVFTITVKWDEKRESIKLKKQ
ncbi:hypothetical protein [Neobacillus sp. YIM B06451]|uniref:hypothetical protein n=1 Tax=Neobacillus sp. YIM B06451 TaxID=3070994 RepID=UPI00292EDD51|nr:hypothetical protein [Neobacillus sp. YIM B06451]